MSDQNDLMELAIAEARKARDQGEVPIGAVVVSREGEVIGRGHNLRESEHSPILHAEIKAIAEASKTLAAWRLLGCTLYTTLEPCIMCLGACQQARLERVLYGAEDLKGGALSLGYRLHEDERTHHRFKVEPLLHQEATALLQEFFRERRAKE